MATPSSMISESLNVHENILETIGGTPLVRLNSIASHLQCTLYAKVEFFNPGGSVKDRIALNMIAEAERSGRLKPGGTVVESTSGNTGVGLAIVCAIKGYKSVFVMPDKMSQEKIQFLRAFGARVVITPTAVEPEDPRSYYNVAKQIVAETPNAILSDQYHNPENPHSHYLTTGPEIWEQTRGRVTDVIVGMGTGGTISGVGRYLKEQNPAIRIVGVDPTGSILLETWQKGSVPKDAVARPYKIEGIGEDFLPSTLDLSIIDEVIRVTDKEAFQWTRRLVRQEGIFCGVSSGAALAGAMRYVQELPSDRLAVVIFPDSGSRYLSKVFDDKWMRENGFLESEWDTIRLSEVLAVKTHPELFTASITDRMVNVIARLKDHGISQMPVLKADGTLAGLVSEVDLFKHVFETRHTHEPEETIESIVELSIPVFTSDAFLEDVLPKFFESPVVLVTEEERPVGILTKIDVLDFIARRI
ncbi:MAG: cystathionine beta-synthase [Anaerolineales bacterium]|nr:cystathionine beta-synthase [Anaerolineales bacterium]